MFKRIEYRVFKINYCIDYIISLAYLVAIFAFPILYICDKIRG